MAKRHTLRSLFAAVFAPFVSAWRDEFGPERRAAKTPAKQAFQGGETPHSGPNVEQGEQDADFGAPYGTKPQEFKGGAHVISSPASSWRATMLERVAAEPAGVRHTPRPAPRTKPAAKRTRPAAKGKAKATGTTGKKTRNRPIAK